MHGAMARESTENAASWFFCVFRLANGLNGHEDVPIHLIFIIPSIQMNHMAETADPAK
jgi:hypothetical protein